MAAQGDNFEQEFAKWLFLLTDGDDGDKQMAFAAIAANFASLLEAIKHYEDYLKKNNIKHSDVWGSQKEHYVRQTRIIETISEEIDKLVEDVTRRPENLRHR